MTQPRPLSLRTLAGVCALVAVIGPAAAQTGTSADSNVPAATAQQQAREIAQGDPARWFRQNPGMGARLRDLQKEIGAALQEAQGACRKLSASERAGCMKEARATYQQDMAGARAQVMAEQP